MLMKLWRTVFAILCFVFASGLVSVEQALASPLPVVAIHDSELTRALESMPASGGTPTGAGTTGNQWWKTEWHYFVMPDSVKEALRSDGTAFTVVGDSNILSGELTNLDGSPKYPILISLASEAIDDNEIARLTNYVAGGGFLIVGSSAFTRNTNGTTRGDFAFGPQLGVHMVTPGLTNWGNDQFFTKVGNHRMVSHVPAGQLNWFMPLSADDIPLGVSGSHLPNSQHQVWQVQATDATVIANGGLGGSLFPYLLVKSYGKGYFIYHAAMQPLLGQGGYDSGMYAYVIFRRAIEWAFEAAKLPVTKVSPWPYAYDAAVIFRHDLEDIPNLINATETSAQFEKSVGAYGEYYFCTGVLRDNYTVSARSNEVASLQRAMSLYGAKIGSHNGGLKNANNLTLATNTYDYWHWGPDEALNVTGAGLNGYANGQSYALAAVSNSFADLRGWGLTNNNSELLYASPNHNSTREPSKQILQQLGVVASGAEKLSPFPHWTFSTQTPGKRFSFLTLPMSEWYVGAQVAQSMENHLTITDVGAAVDFYYNLGALINLYSHSSSAGGPSVAEPDGLGGVAVQTQPALQNFSVTNSVAKPRIWSTNSFGIYGWWLQRSNVVIVPSSSQVGNQMVTTVAITGAVSPQTAVEVFLPGNFASGVQVVTNGVAAGAGSFRVNGQVVKMLVGTSVTNVVVSFPVTPTAQGDAYTMFQNTTLAIPGPGVLTNDAPGLGGSNLTALLVSGPANGTLTLNANGAFSYSPGNNFTGSDSFNYRATDGSLTSGVATVTVAVTSSGALFFDDFTRSGNSSNSLLPWIYQDGTWAITNNQLQGVGNGAPNNYGHVYISNSWTDYSIQAQLQFPSTNIWAAGVGGRLEPTTGAHYAAWVFPEGSQGPNYPPTAGATGTPVLKLIKFQVWQASGSEFTVLQQVNLPPVGTNAHTVRLTFQGTNLVVSFDGSLVISTNDPAAYASGGVTLDAVAYPTPEIVNFDNVVVASLEQGSRITSVSAANGVATVTWTSQAGKTYRLLYKDNLTVANWSVVPGDVAATGATASKTNSVGNVAQRFYRVLLLN